MTVTAMSNSEFVTMRGGLTLPIGALRLAWDLELRGLHLAVDGVDVLSVGPGDRLTENDRALIRQWKWHLLAMLAYDAVTPESVQ
jgi:hypothetical protein